MQDLRLIGRFGWTILIFWFVAHTAFSQTDEDIQRFTQETIRQVDTISKRLGIEEDNSLICRIGVDSCLFYLMYVEGEKVKEFAVVTDSTGIIHHLLPINKHKVTRRKIRRIGIFDRSGYENSTVDPKQLDLAFGVLMCLIVHYESEVICQKCVNLFHTPSIIPWRVHELVLNKSNWSCKIFRESKEKQ